MMNSRSRVVIVLVLFLAIYAAGIFFHQGNTYWLNVWSDFFWTSSSILAAYRCFETSRQMPLRYLKMAWRWFGIGSVFWTMGMFIWTWRQLVQNIAVPFPDLSTFLFLSIIPCITIGLVYYSWNLSHGVNKVINIADVGISLCVISFVCIILFYRTIIEYQGSMLYLLTALAYPFLSITTLFFATLQIWESRPVNKLPYTLLMLGFASFTGVNIAYAYGLLHRFYQTGEFLDVLWTVGFFFLYWAGFEEAELVKKKTLGFDYVMKPNIALALFPGVTLFFVLTAAHTYQKNFQGIDSLLLIIAVVFTILIGIRTWISQTTQFKLQTETEHYAKKLDVIIQQMPAGLAITDPESGQIYLHNHQAEQILRGDLSLIDELQKGKEEMDFTLKNGESLTVLSKVSDIETKTSDRFRVLTFVDITEKKQIYEETKRVARIREDFLLLVSHELKTPLTSLKLGMQFLDKKITDEGLRKVFRPCLEEIKRFEHLTNDLIDISNIDAGRLSLEPIKLNLAELVRNVFSRLDFELKSKKYEVQFLVMEDLYGYWDQLRIEQVIVNLLNNAIKYGEFKPIDVSVTREENFAVFSIHDNGPGISQEDKQRIFRKFERASSTKNFGGFGIGLFVSKNIVEAHKGTLTVNDIEGRGTTFKMRLPLALG